MLILLISIVEEYPRKGRDLISSQELIDVAAKAKLYDPEALSRLFDLFYEKLRRYMYYKTGSLDRAEDLAAETLAKGIENIGNFKDRGGTIGAWLFGIGRNLLAREREVAGKTEMVELDDKLLAEEEKQPESLALEKLDNQRLYLVLSHLPEEQREVVLLRFMEGLDAKTVGKLMGKRPGAVRALQFRAIRSLKEMIESGGVHV
ncbi:MAG: sigma-70 family RNA polymerase sigma factor [Actinomycetota bacterium]|nr:sigma-70 family RNA polymerase sigma factor [Actinomycetota bacterium]